MISDCVFSQRGNSTGCVQDYGVAGGCHIRWQVLERALKGLMDNYAIIADRISAILSGSLVLT